MRRAKNSSKKKEKGNAVKTIDLDMFWFKIGGFMYEVQRINF